MERAMKKTLLIVVAVLMLVVLLTACTKSEVPETPGSSLEGLTVGLSCMDTSWQFFTSVNEGSIDLAEEYGISLNIQDAQNDASKQMEQVEAFITQGVDAIIVDTIDAGSLISLAQKAKEKGIAFIARWTAVEGATCNMLLNEYEYGVAIAELAVEWLNENYPGQEVEVALMGMYDYNPSVIRLEGIKETLLKGFPNAKIVAEEQSADMETAMNAADAIMQAYPNVKMILGDSDDTATIGATEAVKAILDPSEYDSFYIGGADAVDAAIALIKEGSPMKATVDLHNYDIGADSIRLIIEYFEKGSIDPEFSFMFEGIDYETVMAKY